MTPTPWFTASGRKDPPEVLKEDGELILFRAWHDGADRHRQSVLVLQSAAEQPTPNAVNRLAHEYALKDQLDASWAIRPVELLHDHERTSLVLEAPDGLPLEHFMGAPLEPGLFLQLAIAISIAVGRLHERGLVHKDIKPANIFVNTTTGEAWLTGFGIASRAPRERQSPDPPEFIAGTLAYMAPEQTGRMNRSIDSRSDLYSLGVTLYQMLSGRLPFTASDPMEWVHCHVARKPAPLNEYVESIPATLCAVILKLLAKTAEERYQTAAGLESDLRRCLAQWKNLGRIEEFPLGERDTSDRLLIPERLYGRASDIESLLASFDRVVANGTPELVLVSGYSGIGKSSVVNELHKMLVPPRGLFGAGKFDQYKRDFPYATLAQAFQSLVRPLLSKPEAQLHLWRDAFRDALGPNGMLMVDLVPELKHVIGEQPPVPALPPQDAQRRFQLVFRRFISVFARPEHPLALFLDDLQWLDAATLDLVEDLMAQRDVGHLMLIGAYRDNEVSSVHPLIRKLASIRQAGGAVREIVLAPLTREDLRQLIADSLHCELEHCDPLAALVHEKTGGNPFFVIQFITALAEDGLLSFDHGEGRWAWDLNRIHARGYTDNVVDLLLAKLNRLPVETQNALQQLACLGNSADFASLRMVYQSWNEEMHRQFWEAVRAGLVFRAEDSYKFLHDRVQEAAYSLIPEESRAATHLRIGMLLAAHIPAEKREERIFEIVNQLNRGSHLIASADEREWVAKLNLIAGRRAKASTAYASALKYLTAGRTLLSEESWSHNYELIFDIELCLAECELLTAEMVRSETRLSMLAKRARSGHDIAVVTRLRLTLYTTLDRSDSGMEVFLDYLRRSGTAWSLHPTRQEVMREYDRIGFLIGNRQIEDLIELPLMNDPDVLDVLDVFTEAVTPSLFVDENLCSLVICRMVNLSLEHGNSDGSCFAYVWFAIVAGPRFDNYNGGFRFGRLGYELVEKRGLTRYEARTCMSFGNIVLPWARHAREGRAFVRRAFDVANRVGDLTFAAYSCDQLITNFLIVGDPLAEVQRETENVLSFVRKTRFGLVVDIIVAQLGLIRSLRGSTAKFGCFNDGEFDELDFERHLASNAPLALAEFWYWTRKLQARYLAGDHASAVDAALHGQQLLWTSPSQLETAEFHFYAALARTASWDNASGEQRQGQLESLVAHHRQLETWAEHCPENFENRAALVGAEIARIEGRDLDAERLYELAIRSAHANGFIHNEALAHEVAARFYAARGFDKFEEAYLREARSRYVRWGADGKVRQLDQLYPRLRDKAHAAGPTSTIDATLEYLDLATVIKLSQAVSGEIVLERLIDTLMRTAIQHAGAERGVLILARGDEYQIVAEAAIDTDTVRVGQLQSGASLADMPQSVIRYVVRTNEIVHLNDAVSDNAFADDEYIQRHHARSILCLPCLKDTTLIGMLYLENNLTTHAFTQSRMVLLKFLASQAAISLENIRLYGELQEREAKVRRLVDSNIIGIFTWRFDGRIIDGNDAFLRMLGYDRDDLDSGRLRWSELTPAEWREVDNRRMAELKATGTTAQPYEKEYFQKNGGRVPVLVGGATLQAGRENGVAFVIDLTDRKRSEMEARESARRYREVEVALAHASRVATLGQMSASIAHEVNQPVAATMTNAQAALRFLAAEPPDLEEVSQALNRIARLSNRVIDVVGRIRALVTKSSPRQDEFQLNEAIDEVISLSQGEIEKHKVALHRAFAARLPLVHADRVQVQQVILNLITNAVEAMSGLPEEQRELRISTDAADAEQILVSVRDSGPGLDPANLNRVFDSFYSTKPGGLGIGLSIGRSIVEAHGGRLWVEAGKPRGAVFKLTLPIDSRRAH
jgi:PAS domain S-box-containing protein